MNTVSPNPMDKARLQRAKAAYAIRRIKREDMAALVKGEIALRAGDLVLARVEKVGQHQRIELADGRKSRLYPGDEILLCLGNRYAPDQFEALIPDEFGQCELVAAGGVAAKVICRSDKVNAATVLEIIGRVADAQGNILNLADYALPDPGVINTRQVVLGVVGTAMNAGKTETMANLIHGLIKAGFTVGAAKVTGTGAGGDVWSAIDAGAYPVYDFTDIGLPSTYKMPFDQVERAAINLVTHLSHSPVDVIVLEVADGLYQHETAQLLASSRFTSLVHGFVFAAGDAMGAVAGTGWLLDKGLPIVGISGLLTQSPLAIREVQEGIKLQLALRDHHQAAMLPVFDIKTLRNPLHARELVSPFLVEAQSRQAS